VTQHKSNCVGSRERHGVIQPDVGTEHFPTLFKREGLGLFLGRSDREFRGVFPAGELPLPDFPQKILGHPREKFPDQFVLGADKSLRASGVALPRGAAE
jgi:hypothetical protein